MISAMSAATIQRDWVGRVIDGRFSLLQWLGGGERSGVFLTELPGPQAKKAAIKLSPDDGAASDSTVASWAAARPLSHPHLMRLIHTGRCESEGEAVLYAVSEYADEVLSEILPERALTPDEAREMLVPVVDALQYLHGKGLVHGHLKPRNVLVVDDQLKISGDQLQVAGEAGTPVELPRIYDAPERASGMVSAAGDVWSLGVTLVEALTQRPPVWDREAGGEPQVPESIPEPLNGIARECLRVDAASRLTLGSLKTWLKTGQPGDPDSEGKLEKKLPGRFGITALVAAVVVVVVVVALVEMRPKATQETQQAVPAQTDSQQAADNSTATPAPTPAQSQEPAPETAAAAQPKAETPAPTAQKPSPSIAAAPVAAAPAPETHASKPIQMQDMGVGGPVAQQVMPDYQERALNSIHGKFVVKVRATTDSAGNVTNAEYESEGPSSYFAKASLEAVKKWKFKPTPGASGKWIVQFVYTHDGPQMTTAPAQ